MSARPVLIVASAYPPENVIGALRPARFARYLPDHGYAPVVVTGSDQPVPVPGVTVAPFRYGILERLLGRTLFPHDDRATWMPAAVAAARRLISASSRPILLSTVPPVSGHWAASRLRKQYGLRWMADFRDPLVGNFTRGRTWLSARADRFIERRIARDADRIVFNTPYAADAFRARYPEQAGKVRFLYNGFDPDEPIEALPAGAGGRVWIHCGSLYLNRYPERLFTALDSLVSSGRLAPDFRVRMIGSVEDASLFRFPPYARLQERGLIDCLAENVPRRQALGELCAAGGAMVFDHYHGHGPNLAIPAKTFEAVRLGRPMLVFTSRGAPLHSLMENCGIAHVCVLEEDGPAEVEEKILAYAALPPEPRAPSRWFLERFSAAEQTRQLAAWLDEL